MILNKECRCGASLEFEAEDLPTLTCPTCSAPLQDQFGKPPLPRPSFDPPPEPVTVRERKVSERRSDGTWSERRLSEGESRSEFALRDVRQESCYKALRNLIDIVFGLAYAALTIGPVVMFFSVVGKGAQAGNPEIVLMIISVVLALVGVLILMASKQALLLLIDIADVLVSDRADRLSR